MVRGNVPELGSLSPFPEKEAVTVTGPTPVPSTVIEQPVPDTLHVVPGTNMTLPASDHETVEPAIENAAPETVAVQVVIEPTLTVEELQTTDVIVNMRQEDEAQGSR
jgi:hypothetical protein